MNQPSPENGPLPLVAPTEAEIRAANLDAQANPSRLSSKGEAAGARSESKLRLSTRPFEYMDWKFLCVADEISPQNFVARVLCHSKASPGPAETYLSVDSRAYGTADEALRHAEQQAMRWANDRNGPGVGQA